RVRLATRDMRRLAGVARAAIRAIRIQMKLSSASVRQHAVAVVAFPVREPQAGVERLAGVQIVAGENCPEAVSSRHVWTLGLLPPLTPPALDGQPSRRAPCDPDPDQRLARQRPDRYVRQSGSAREGRRAMQLDSRTALVTGATGGIGHAIARALAGRG